MFDKYIICEEGFRRHADRGARIEVRMPYYRGLGLVSSPNPVRYPMVKRSMAGSRMPDGFFKTGGR